MKFKKINYFSRKKMSIEDLISYHAEQRKFNYVSGKRLRGITFRKRIYPLIR